MPFQSGMSVVLKVKWSVLKVDASLRRGNWTSFQSQTHNIPREEFQSDAQMKCDLFIDETSQQVSCACNLRDIAIP